MTRRFFLLIFLFVFGLSIFSSNFAVAGGALTVLYGEPVLWPEDSIPVTYNLDLGDLGPIAHDAAVQLVVKAFDAWQNPTTTSIRIERGSDLPVDVAGDNFRQYLDENTAGIHPIVFDHDGSIVRALAGNGAEDNILGLAGPVQIFNEQIAYNQIILNGVILETHGFSQDDLYPTLLHEFGHFLGLDHSQIYRHIAYDSVGGNDMYTPIMLPDSADDESVRDRLTDEDILSISNLYPATGFFEETGTIEGVVRREDQELPGINVIARQVGAVTDRIYSIVTGAYEYNRGTYKFAGLPSGEYQVFVEPLDRSYTGVSSVGRYSQSLMGQSFRNPPPAQFYHETGESSGRSVWTTIAVAEGETVGDIDLLVQLGDVPSDELDTQLLGLNSPEIGGVSGSGSSEFQFLLAPSEDEGRIELTVRADDPDAAFDVTISIDRFVTWADQPIRSSANGIASVLIAADGDIPLEPTRYFISIHNQGDREMTFVITASAAGTSTLCPFSVY